MILGSRCCVFKFRVFHVCGRLDLPADKSFNASHQLNVAFTLLFFSKGELRFPGKINFGRGLGTRCTFTLRVFLFSKVDGFPQKKKWMGLMTYLVALSLAVFDFLGRGGIS